MNRKTNAIYNMNTKTAFTETIPEKQLRDIAMACFRDTAPLETAAGRDICTFSGAEEDAVWKAVMGTMLRSRSRELAAKVMSKYYKWCVETDVPGAVEHEPVKQEVIDAVNADLLIFSPAHLQSILDKIFDPEADGTVDNTYRCFYWMAYAGLSTESIMMLKPEHFDLKSFLVSVNGEHGILYRQAILCIENCISIPQFLYEHPLYANQVMKDRIPGDYVLRGIRGTYDDPARYYKSLSITLSRRVNASGTNLSYHSCYYGGLFYRIHEQELCYGTRPDLKSIAVDTPAGKRIADTAAEYRTSVHERLYQISSKIEKDYQLWKKALNQR